MSTALLVVVFLVAGYLLGGLPTAEWLAARRGLDLRRDGSGNPGANNARLVGGLTLALGILGVEIVKGAAAVLIARQSGDAAMVAGGVGAVAGNVLNPYRRLSGGQGLGISAGVLCAAWPVILVPVLVTIASVSIPLKSAPKGALTAMGLLLVGSLMWIRAGLPTAWGVSSGATVPLALGMVFMLAPKQTRNYINDRQANGRPAGE